MKEYQLYYFDHIVLAIVSLFARAVSAGHFKNLIGHWPADTVLLFALPL